MFPYLAKYCVITKLFRILATSPFPFSLQLDESTDVSYCSQLVCYVHYVNGNEIKEEFLFCELLLETAKVSDAFQKVNNFSVKQNILTAKRK